MMSQSSLSSGTELLFLYSLNGFEARFPVDKDTANVKEAKSLFAKEASNPESDKMYAIRWNDKKDKYERPAPMANGRFIPVHVLAIVDEKGDELKDNVLLKDVGWKLQVIVKDLVQCFPLLEGAEVVTDTWFDYSIRGGVMHATDAAEFKSINDFAIEQFVLSEVFVEALSFNVERFYKDDSKQLSIFIFNPDDVSSRGGHMWIKNSGVFKVDDIWCIFDEVHSFDGASLLEVCLFFMSADSIAICFENHLDHDFLSHKMSMGSGSAVWDQNCDMVVNILQKTRNFLSPAHRLRITEAMENGIVESLDLPWRDDVWTHNMRAAKDLRLYPDLASKLEIIDEVYSRGNVLARLQQHRVQLIATGCSVKDLGTTATGSGENIKSYGFCSLRKFSSESNRGRSDFSSRDKKQTLIAREESTREMFSEVFGAEFPVISVQEDGFEISFDKGEPLIYEGETKPTSVVTIHWKLLMKIFGTQDSHDIWMKIFGIRKNDTDDSTKKASEETMQDGKENNGSDCESEFIVFSR